MEMLVLQNWQGTQIVNIICFRVVVFAETVEINKLIVKVLAKSCRDLHGVAIVSVTKIFIVCSKRS